MKWLGILLLLVNLAVLGWGLQRESVDMPQQPPKHAGVGNLKLLSEIMEANREVSTPKPESIANPLESNDEVKEDTPSLSASVSNADQKKERSDSKAVEGQLSAQSVLEDKIEEPPSVSMESQEPQAERDAVPSDETVSTKAIPPVLVCGAFGPFERGAEAREVAESLSSQGMDSSLRREAMEKPIGYWVVIPPLDSQEGAIEKVKKLKESGISDIRRFIKGDQRNGISLGVFSSKDNAKLRQQEVAKKGHVARVIPRLITVPTYWIDYRSTQERAAKATKSLKQKNESIKNDEYPCSRVVTSGGIF